jgi:hypothetical protein
MRHSLGELLKMGPIGDMGPIAWKQDEHLDSDYHIRHSALPKPDGLHPANIPFHGFPISITLVSNNKNLDFGITACRRSLPSVQRPIDYMEETLVEMEGIAGLGSRKPARKKASRKAPQTKEKKREVKRSSVSLEGPGHSSMMPPPARLKRGAGF